MPDTDGAADATRAPPRRAQMPAGLAVVGVNDSSAVVSALHAWAVEAGMDTEDVVERSVAERQLAGVARRDDLPVLGVTELVLRQLNTDDSSAGSFQDRSVEAGSTAKIEAEAITAIQEVEERFAAELRRRGSNFVVPVREPVVPRCGSIDSGRSVTHRSSLLVLRRRGHPDKDSRSMLHGHGRGRRTTSSDSRSIDRAGLLVQRVPGRSPRAHRPCQARGGASGTGDGEPGPPP